MGLPSLCLPNNGPQYCTLPSVYQEDNVPCCALQFKGTFKHVVDSMKGKKWKQYYVCPGDKTKAGNALQLKAKAHLAP